jgi:hypothetical protein
MKTPQRMPFRVLAGTKSIRQKSLYRDMEIFFQALKTGQHDFKMHIGVNASPVVIT